MFSSEERRCVELILKKALNNNAVIAIDDSGKECVLFGKGITFELQKNQTISEEKIERVFFQKEKTILEQLLESIPQKHFDLTCEIIEYLQENLKITLSNSLYITLMDHITFICERAKKGLLPRNELKWEISRYYPSEFHICKKVVELLEDEFEIELNEDEAASIALHVINATIEGKNISEGIKSVHLVDDLLQIICFQTDTKADEEDLNYQRLVTHIKFFVQRIWKKQSVSADLSLYHLIIEKYKDAYEIAVKVKEFVEKKLECKVQDGEIAYLVIHIERLLNSKES